MRRHTQKQTRFGHKTRIGRFFSFILDIPLCPAGIVAVLGGVIYQQIVAIIHQTSIVQQLAEVFIIILLLSLSLPFAFIVIMWFDFVWKSIVNRKSDKSEITPPNKIR